jgi:hypothetical protein
VLACERGTHLAASAVSPVHHSKFRQYTVRLQSYLQRSYGEDNESGKEPNEKKELLPSIVPICIIKPKLT